MQLNLLKTMKKINELETELAALNDKLNSPLSCSMSEAEVEKLEARIMEVEEELIEAEKAYYGDEYYNTVSNEEQEYRSNVLAPQTLSLNRRMA